MTTVRLYSLAEEHTYPLLLDLAFFLVTFTAWVLIFGDHFTALALVPVVLFHLVQVIWFVQVRFDDEGITIIRSLRRRRVAWSQVAGLVYTKANGLQTRSPYKLRLVLVGHEPPFGRYLSPAELGRYATGPVVMMLSGVPFDLFAGPDTRTARCQQLVYDELERRGFPRPPAGVLQFRSPKYTPEEARLAAAEDFLRRRDQK